MCTDNERRWGCAGAHALSFYSVTYAIKSQALTHISLASCLCDISKQYSPRCDAAKHGVLSGPILFAKRNLIEKWNKI